MERKPKFSLSAFFLVGIIYAAIGGLFLILGICLMILPADSEAKLVGSIFAPIGGLFFILGAVFLAVEFYKRRQAQQLLDSGRYVWGEIIELAPNLSIRINGRSPYVAIVRFVDGRGLSHIFKSRNLRIYPDPSMIGKKVKIYYKDDSFKPYYVDIDQALPQVIEH